MWPRLTQFLHFMEDGLFWQASRASLRTLHGVIDSSSFEKGPARRVIARPGGSVKLAGEALNILTHSVRRAYCSSERMSEERAPRTAGVLRQSRRRGQGGCVHCACFALLLWQLSRHLLTAVGDSKRAFICRYRIPEIVFTCRQVS